MVLLIKCKSKGLSGESITDPATKENGFAPKLTYVHNFKKVVKFEGNWCKQNKIFFFIFYIFHLFYLPFFIYELDI